ncbi:MAG: chlorosome envelope protein B [Chlorobium sp.]|nr:chlorosome envelope protein B [Chlorobium sp.]
MSNETIKNNDLSALSANLVETLGKINQQQVEMITNGIKSATDVFLPLSKASIELTTSFFNALLQILQNVLSAIVPKPSTGEKKLIAPGNPPSMK